MAQNSRSEREAKAAEVRASQDRKEKRRRFLNIGAVVVVVVLIAVVAFAVTRMGGSPNSADLAKNAPAAGTSDYGVTIGPADAPHTVVIYEDFLCPFCGAFEKASGDDLTQLAQEGKVQVDYRPFQLFTDIDYSAQALNAFAVVLDAAGPEAAKTFHDELYADQPDERGPYPDLDSLVSKAVDAGASESDVRPGIEDMAQQTFVDGATKGAADAGVKSTPTILLDGQPFTKGQSVDDLAANLVTAIG